MANFTIEYKYTWEGTVDIEADSKEKAEELFYEAVDEGELDDQYCPKEFPTGDYEITNIEEENA